jgi:8-oxo-dGTP pyrophosphatase MutT (NUDIX family)
VPSYYGDPDAPEPNGPRRIGVIGIVERDGRVLVQRRADDGAWDFVGGALGEEETVLEALAREVHEESGLQVLEASLLGIFSDPSRIIEYPDGSVCRLLSIVFRVAADAREPRKSEESLELRFVERGELAEMDVWPSVRPVRDAYLERAGVVVA